MIFFGWLQAKKTKLGPLVHKQGLFVPRRISKNQESAGKYCTYAEHCLAPPVAALSAPPAASASVVTWWGRQMRSPHVIQSVHEVVPEDGQEAEEQKLREHVVL